MGQNRVARNHYRWLRVDNYRLQLAVAHSGAGTNIKPQRAGTRPAMRPEETVKRFPLRVSM